MNEQSTEQGGRGWHTYRCPVCGHTDEVELAEGVTRSIPCSHCDTPLNVVVLDPDTAAVEVTVAEPSEGKP